MNDVYDAILRDIPTRGIRSKLESCAGLIVESRRHGQANRISTHVRGASCNQNRWRARPESSREREHF